MIGVAGLAPIMQIAYVPEDFDKALEFWTRTMGVGPFCHMEHVEVPLIKYRGVPAQIDFSIALAYWGDIQIELVQQHNDAPSIYSEWRTADMHGMHHICQLVDDIEVAKEACLRAGGDVVQELKLEGGAAIYVDMGGGPGAILEIIQAPTALSEMFARVKAASKVWDGSAPLRPSSAF